MNSHLGVLGSEVDLTEKLSLPVCDKFLPVVLEGQLCYSLDLEKVMTNATREEQTHGLTLILDLGVDMTEKTEDTKVDKIESLSLKTNSLKREMSRIYIDTLEPFSDFREGEFSLHAVKDMTGTENFMNLADNVKKCSKEPFEQCRVEKYLRVIEKTCGCVPWALWDSKIDKVKRKKKNTVN